MAKLLQKERALALRREGESYNEIKSKVGVSKGTLSLWLRDMPLSDERIRELRGSNPKRIEKYRNTCAKRRARELAGTYEKIKEDIGKLSNRELFLSGLFLYWAEGTKNYGAITSLANTDPGMILFFIAWLKHMEVPIEKIKIRLHLYADMNVDQETIYWSKILNISISQFRKPYIKTSKLSSVSDQRGGYGHGTCNILYGNRPFNDYVLQSILFLKQSFE